MSLGLTSRPYQRRRFAAAVAPQYPFWPNAPVEAGWTHEAGVLAGRFVRVSDGMAPVKAASLDEVPVAPSSSSAAGSSVAAQAAAHVVRRATASAREA